MRTKSAITVPAVPAGAIELPAGTVSQLNAHGFGWLGFVGNAAAHYVAGTSPIAVYTHDSCP
jgi:hypothetical protein